jgi:hypothetical protein
MREEVLVFGSTCAKLAGLEKAKREPALKAGQADTKQIPLGL